MKRTPRGSRNGPRAAASRILIGLVLLSSILLPLGVQASPFAAGRDPVWNARLKDVPAWLSMADTSSQLYSEYDLPTLAGKLILFGSIDASDCPNGGFSANGEANECGLQRARLESGVWQNRFNDTILLASQESGVPPLLLKNIFAWESQFWPQTTIVNTYEYGLGHMTLMGADSTLRWNVPFYDSICAASFSSDTCRENYADQPQEIRAALQGVVIQRVNADCPGCTYFLDLPLAERSVSLFADTLLANVSLIKLITKDSTGRKAGDSIAYEDLWKFTLTSYNAGPGCFIHAFSILVGNHLPLDWENFSAQLEPGCAGAVEYVNFISQADHYHPENDPALLPDPQVTGIPAPIETPAVLTETPVISSTVTVTVTVTPVPETLTPTASLPISETLTVTPTPDGSLTPEITLTIVPTSTETTVMPTATLDPSASATVTPTPLDGTPAGPLPTLDVTATVTSTLPQMTLTPTATYTPTVTATPADPTPDPFASNYQPRLPIDGPYAGDEIVVKIDPQFQESALATLQAMGIDLSQDVTRIDALDTWVVRVAPDLFLPILGVLQNDSSFLFAEPNYLVSSAGQINDPEYTYQDNLPAVQAPQAWDLLPSMQEVLVAVVDSGVDLKHPDLADRIFENAGELGTDRRGIDKRSNNVDDDGNGYVDDWQGWNMVFSNSDVTDAQGHGTHLAGIIGAGVNNLIGVAGIAPNARILPVTVLDHTGSGTYSQVAEGVIYATDMGARIINLGFTGTGTSVLLQSAIDYAIQHDVLVVAAGGNDGKAIISYPAGYPGVLAVSAVDSNGYWAPFSNSGDHISLSAPGLDVYSTSPGGFYWTASGTSQAAAHVSGVAALLAGQPEFSDSASLRAPLLMSARDLGDPGQDPYFGYGLVQAYDALSYAGLANPTPTPVFAPSPTPNSPTNDLPMFTEELWGRTQIAYQAISSPGNSIDGAFNDLLASSTGPYGASSARNWVFTSIDDTSFSTVAAVYLDMRLYFQNWVDDAYRIQVYEPTNPGCAFGWCTVMTIKTNPSAPDEALPPTSLTTLSVPVTSVLNSAAKVNGTQVRLSGYVAVGGVVDVVTIYMDEVRLRVLDVLPPTPTPSPTPVFIPTATIPATRAATAVPGTAEPHSNFVATSADQCASCHRSHTAQSNELRSEALEEQVCFSCHTAGGSGTNVQPAFTAKSNTPTRFFSHAVSATTKIHRVDETVGPYFSGANRHIECEDCHSPHSSARSQVPNPAPAVQQEMYQSSGVEPVWTSTGAPINYNWLSVADREFQVCIKCHSSYAALPTYSPDGYGWNATSNAIGYIANGLGKLSSSNPAQVPDSRDMAKEFNSYQVSFHPVAAQGRNVNMNPGSFVAPWTQDSIVFCTDCHDDAAGATNGPHGSPLLHILDGSAEYITQTDPAQSCAPGGCPSIHNPGELCFKCHQFGTYATNVNLANTTRFRNGTENLHAFHSFGSCYTCHDSHGSEQDHLINFDTSVVYTYPGSNSQTAWDFNSATNTGTCYVACHDGDHGNDPTKQYTP